MQTPESIHEQYIKLAIKLAKKAEGVTSPNPIVGAVLVKDGKIIGSGYHHRAGLPHAEIEAINDARRKGNSALIPGSTIYVTLEPCSTHGKTPPCVNAIINEKIKCVVYGATDPNPLHSGRAKKILTDAGVQVIDGVLAEECASLNPAFNHWIVHKTPYVILKSAMTLDGKIATASGESKWITGEKARRYAMNLRKISDAILVGVNTVIADNPSLTYRGIKRIESMKKLRRIILDPNCRIPLNSTVVTDRFSSFTTVVVSENADAEKVRKLQTCVNVLKLPFRDGRLDLNLLMKKLGEDNVLALLVEGGGNTNAAFFESRLVNRVVFFYAPKIICGRDAVKAVAGKGFSSWNEIPKLRNIKFKKMGDDLMIDALVSYD
jgi:diaminohydroxyphosphoribosylaminopyrimidine deaminase/5-amino-6-(5-phosphoribosylamino)uracil reductase